MEPTHIEVRGARVHNLCDVSLKLPRNALICLTGVSGSGKSSLAFDTLYAEGQRRYVESLSSYARQFLGQIEKPDCDWITGLSPSISIQQKTAGNNPRSTVGTITAIQDFLRVLYARIGRQYCTECERPITAQSREQIIAAILTAVEGRRALILAPVVRGQKGEFRDLFADLLRAGYVRARVDGDIVALRDEISLIKNRRHNIEVVIDRIRVESDDRARLAESVDAALRLGEGTLIVAPVDDSADGQSAAVRKRHAEDASSDELIFSSQYACAECSRSYEPPTPQMFSFNAPSGMCLQCDGLGEMVDFDLDSIVPDDSKSFLAPCIAPMRTKPGKWRRHIYKGVAEHLGIELDTPWRDLPETARQSLLFGTGDAHITYTWRFSGGEWKHGGKFEGVVNELRDKYRKSSSRIVRNYYEQFMRKGACSACHGRRLNSQALAVRLNCPGWLDDAAPAVARERGRTGRGIVRGGNLLHADGPGIAELSGLSVDRIMRTIDRLKLSPVEEKVAAEVLKEVRARLTFLMNVGLHYLTLDRTAPTLSGGEAQRIRLAGQIGSGLAGVLYVLDEPSIGLHPRDNLKLLESLKALRDMGNTVLVVEHDEETMREADHIVDFGPGPGVRGGHVVAEGTLAQIKKCGDSLTGQYLSGQRCIDVPAARRPVTASPPPKSKTAAAPATTATEPATVESTTAPAPAPSRKARKK